MGSFGVDDGGLTADYYEITGTPGDVVTYGGYPSDIKTVAIWDGDGCPADGGYWSAPIPADGILILEVVPESVWDDQEAGTYDFTLTG
jgi:hypothetical protein